MIHDRFGRPFDEHAIVCTDPRGARARLLSSGRDISRIRWIVSGIEEQVLTGDLMVVPDHVAEHESGTEAHQLVEAAVNPLAGRIDELRGFGTEWSEARKKLFESTDAPCEICDIDTPEMRRRRNNELSMSLQRDAEQLGWTTHRRSDTYFQARREEKDDDGVLISEHLGIMVRDDGIDVADIREHAATPAAVAMMLRRSL